MHQRADADKATEEAELHRVSSMLAAGWGATSTVMESASLYCSAISTPSVFRRRRSATDSDVRFCQASVDDFEIPAFLRKQNSDQEPESLKAVALAVVEHLAHGGRVQGLAAHCEALELHPDARLALDQAVDLGASDGHALLLLAHWTNARTSGLGSSMVAATLQPHLDGLDASLIDKCVKLFDRLLGGYAIGGWALSRTQRLRRALTRALP